MAVIKSGLQVQSGYCACGQLLHYKDKDVEKVVMEIVARKGENMIAITNDKKYSVQRHYIALHGLFGMNLAILAAKGIVKEID